MNEYMILFAQGFALNAVASLVPGPDMLLVLRSSTARGRVAGLLSAAGIVCGLVVYSLVALLAASAIAAAPPLLFDVVRLAGALYLGYLGAQLLRSQGMPAHAGAEEGSAGRGYLAQGLITNLTNPKCVLFYLAVLTQFDAARQGLGLRGCLLAGLVIGPLCSFVSLSFLGGFVHSRLTPRATRRIDRASGALLLGFAVLAVAVTVRAWLAA
jgi:threonine/homoserine/homoserine lactone efflux protein